MRYTYKIKARSDEVGGGWRLLLSECDLFVGGGVYLAQEGSQVEVDIWWQGMSEAEQDYWSTVGSEGPAGAYRSFMMSKAYMEAEAAGQKWLDSKCISTPRVHTAGTAERACSASTDSGLDESPTFTG